MRIAKLRIQSLALAALILLVPGCSESALAASDEEAIATAADRNDDPLRSFNRPIFEFNNWADEYAIEPIARGWDYVTPDPVQTSLANFFENLLFPIRFANDLLQGELDPAVLTLSRFCVNTTVGFAGFFDPASTMQLPGHRANFGQTLGKWGVPPGPYLVLPLLGSSDVRDTVGLIVDGYLGVTSFFVEVPILIGSAALNSVNRRSMVLDQVDSVRGASLDLYAAARDAYFQQREELIKGEERARRDREDDLYFPEDEAEDTP